MSSDDSTAQRPPHTDDAGARAASQVEELHQELTEIRRHLQRGDADANRIRSLVMLLGCWFSAAFVVLGLFTPYITVTAAAEYGPAGAYAQPASHTFPLIAAFAHASDGSSTADGSSDPAAIVAGIGFGGLVVVAVLALFVLRSIAVGRAGRAVQRYARVVAVLLSIGTVVALLLELFAADQDHDGAVLLTVGALGVTILTGSSSIRQWWVPDSPSRR